MLPLHTAKSKANQKKGYVLLRGGTFGRVRIITHLGKDNNSFAVCLFVDFGYPDDLDSSEFNKE